MSLAKIPGFFARGEIPKWPPNRGPKIKMASIKLKSTPNCSAKHKDSKKV